MQTLKSLLCLSVAAATWLVPMSPALAVTPGPEPGSYSGEHTSSPAPPAYRVASVGTAIQTASEGDCATAGEAPSPTPVAVDRVPIVVPSTTQDYFVLYIVGADGDAGADQPVAVIRGEAGTTELAENLPYLAARRYRVEKYSIDSPADVDGDCIDDLTELAHSDTMNPVNAAPTLDADDGSVTIADRDAYDALSQGSFVKFVLFGLDDGLPGVYFINSKEHRFHGTFMKAANLTPSEVVKGHIAYNPDVITGDGSAGGFHFGLDAQLEFREVEMVQALLGASMPLLETNLAYYVWDRFRPHIEPDLATYRRSRVDVVFDEDVRLVALYESYNPGVSFGLLRALDAGERPNPTDIVVLDTLPNELPRTAGIVTTVPQTPLAHVNLRAIQDRIPNSFIRDIGDDPRVLELMGSIVRYEVSESGWDIRAASVDEVNAHREALDPRSLDPLRRDLSVTTIRPLSEVDFDAAASVGAKAANVAVLGRLGLGAGAVPDGFAIPFHFYDAFMRANGLHERVDELLQDEQFRTDFDVQQSELSSLRDAIRDAPTPGWINDALAAMHAAFPEGTSLRYRSSTNNEDLVGFSGAGLYTSKTQHPDEEPLSKSLKQVYASLWTFRAFTAREFHGIDHTKTAMGVLVHPNFSDELVNGVAVSFDPVNERDDYYYVNSQLGEDLVTNPESQSLPEEILLGRDDGGVVVLRASNQVGQGESLMSDDQLDQLRRYLTLIHEGFARLYDVEPGEEFAIEIEFKITSDNVLAVKQARPWIFADPSRAGTAPEAGVDDASQDERRATVRRLSGLDRYGTSLTAAQAVAAEAGGKLKRIVLTTGRDWPDALLAAGLAGPTDGAVLMVHPNGLSSEALEDLAAWGVTEAVAVGSEANLSSAALASVEAIGIPVQRVAGPDHYETALRVARLIGADAMLGAHGRTVVVASGAEFADALVAGPLAARAGMPVLLTTPHALHPGVREFLTAHAIEHVVLMGGNAALSEDVEEEIEALGAEVTRIGGASRYHTAQNMARFMADTFGGECGGANNVGLASGTEPVDALSAAPLLGRLCAPVLLGSLGELPAATRSEMRARHWAGNLRLHIFGGPYAIPRAVATRAANPY